MENFKAALCQMSEGPDAERNLRKSVEYIHKAKEAGAGLIVFPECYNCVLPRGSGFQAILQTAESPDGKFVTEMRAAAAKTGLWVVFGLREKVPGDTEHTKNAVVVVNGKGEIEEIYHKTHLFDGLGFTESKHVLAGNELFKVLDTPFGKMGLFVCFELRFPEVARLQALQGADFLVMPAAWVKGKQKGEQLHTLVKARAVENACHVLCCNLTGEVSAGLSCVADPMGELTACMGEEEGLLIAEIDYEKQNLIREKLPVLDGRRTDLYSLK